MTSCTGGARYAAKTDVGSDEPVAKKAKLEQAAVPGIRFEITEGSAGRTEEGAYFSMGGDTYKVPMSMHKANRDRICERMRKVGAAGLVLLKGGASTLRYDTDHEPVFRQESYFNWCFGVKEPDFLGAIEIATGKAVLFMPRLAQVCHSPPPTPRPKILQCHLRNMSCVCGPSLFPALRIRSLQIRGTHENIWLYGVGARGMDWADRITG